jgi:RNA polymerase sigma-70 factor (ECF subfamily)
MRDENDDITERVSPGIAADERNLVVHMAGIAIQSRDSLSALYESTVGRLYGIARAVTGCKQDAEDVVCDVFIHLWHNASQYDTRRGSVTCWMAVLTRNKAIDLIRKRRHHESWEDLQSSATLPLSSTADGPDEFLERFQRSSLVRRLLAELSPVQRRVVAFAFMQGLCHVEIAALTGMPMGTVKSHIRRALKSMHKSLAPVDRVPAENMLESGVQTSL